MATPVGAFRPSLDGTSVSRCRAFRAGSGNRSCVAPTPASMPSPARAKRRCPPWQRPLRGLVAPTSPPPRGPGKAGARPARQKRSARALHRRRRIHIRTFEAIKKYQPRFVRYARQHARDFRPKETANPLSGLGISRLDRSLAMVEHPCISPNSGST